MVKEKAGEKKKQEKTQILQRSEIQFDVGKKKTIFFGDTDPKEEVKENGLKRFPDVETKTRVERHQNRPQEVNSAKNEREGEEEKGRERGVGGDKTTEIKEDPRSKMTAAGEK